MSQDCTEWIVVAITNHSRYGYGAEYVLQMKAVTADGSIVTVYPDKTVFQNGR